MGREDGPARTGDPAAEVDDKGAGRQVVGDQLGVPLPDRVAC